jgi:hypothetical protein
VSPATPNHQQERLPQHIAPYGAIPNFALNKYRRESATGYGV